MHANCERARQWTSADVDGELSTFERVLLADHLADCTSCREFRASVHGLTSALRVAPLERFEGIVTGRILRRRYPRLRLAPAVAAMAIAAVGLGSLLASSEVRPGSVSHLQRLDLNAASAAVDTMNLSTAGGLKRLKPARRPSARRSLRGGPVLFER